MESAIKHIFNQDMSNLFTKVFTCIFPLPFLIKKMFNEKYGNVERILYFYNILLYKEKNDCLVFYRIYFMGSVQIFEG